MSFKLQLSIEVIFDDKSSKLFSPLQRSDIDERKLFFSLLGSFSRCCDDADFAADDSDEVDLR